MLSIIIPSRNEEFLEKTVDDIFNKENAIDYFLVKIDNESLAINSQKAYEEEKEKNELLSKKLLKVPSERNINIHQLLEEKASKLVPGESGLLALDWWNGTRSVLVDTNLTGVLLGATLLTKPEEIYRALIEATAFGTNMIVETFTNAGVPIEQLYACGGLSQKNNMLMQIYADATGLEIRVATSLQTPALGAAMFGAVAAGKEFGGYDTIFDAAAKMTSIKQVYIPIPENVARYRKLYAEYKILHDYFGRGANDVMKRLKEIKKNTKYCKV